MHNQLQPTVTVPNKALAMMEQVKQADHIRRGSNEDNPSFSNEAKVESRLVVVDQVSHHRTNDPKPMVVLSSYARIIDNSDEQTYQREVTVGEEWQVLSPGWIEKASQLIVENREGTHFFVNPSKEELDSVAKSVVEISFRGDTKKCDGEVPARESLRLRPGHLDNLWLRCRNGKAKVVITLIPA